MRVRLIGGDATCFATHGGGGPDIALYDQLVLEAGRIEMLTFLHEQAIVMTARRFGSPFRLPDEAAVGLSIGTTRPAGGKLVTQVRLCAGASRPGYGAAPP